LMTTTPVSMRPATLFCVLASECGKRRAKYVERR
jgi:hypothetical protein